MATCPKCHHTWSPVKGVRKNERWEGVFAKSVKFPPSVICNDADEVREWQTVTGRRDRPQRIEGPLMPPDEVGRLMIALNKKTLKSLEI